jgi:two-component system alkaline phosphatase synthesis response regulator PhoP
MTAKHILVIEDEEHLAIGIRYNLTAEGYEVTTVGDGKAALAYLEEHGDRVDLVILDLMLPGMSGYAVCEAMRSAGRDVPVLILSARTLSEDRTRGFDVGADQYLTKPFDLDELLSRVKNLLSRYGRRQAHGGRAAAAAPVFEFGGWKVDFRTFEVSSAKETARLTHLEMKLLQYFVENPGRIVSREELLENVWDQPGYINTRAPDQFIRRLRKQFEPDPAQPRYFLTIRDAGYRFVPEGTERASQEEPEQHVDGA